DMFYNGCAFAASLFGCRPQFCMRAKEKQPSRDRQVLSAQLRESDRVYASLREMAIRFKLKPGERMTELDIAERFSVSRTPVREALNRLVNEGFLVPDGARGFAVRELDPKQCFDLYELRLSLESTAVRLAVERASDEQLAQLSTMAKRANREPADCGVERIVELDEEFHEQIAALSGNAQLAETLRSVNARIRFVRLIDMEDRPRSRSLGDHVTVARALEARDAETAIKAIEEHVTRKLQDMVQVVRRGIARIYVEDFDRQSGNSTHHAAR
ncbi:MAG TPA: GntR family transcriptional regulator, partial [Candidatus Angelobacter sp.]|nr:GntR family transcriptional regulator [Candidatus Angelobacter sp.]